MWELILAVPIVAIRAAPSDYARGNVIDFLSPVAVPPTYCLTLHVTFIAWQTRSTPSTT